MNKYESVVIVNPNLEEESIKAFINKFSDLINKDGKVASVEEIEEKLKDYLGANKILWLPRGIAGDETNEHVDNICAFIDSARVVLATSVDATPRHSRHLAQLEHPCGC